MKFLPVFIVSTISSFLSIYESAIKVVSADIVVRFVFNNGVSPNSTVYCSQRDYDRVDKIFSFDNVNRRHLRPTITGLTTGTTNESIHRKLRTYAKYCKNYCAKYATGTCRATKCLGYRRSLNRVERSEQSIQVALAKTCNESLTSMTTQLEELISKNLVSNTCKLFLNNNTRASTCYDDVIYGEIEGYRIWNLTASSSGSNSASVLFQSDNMTIGSGYSFCKQTVFNVEVISNDCIENVQITVLGPKQFKVNRTEQLRPFTIFSSAINDNTDTSKGNITLLGRTVPYVGTYNVTIVPDGTSTKKKHFGFTILDC